MQEFEGLMVGFFWFVAHGFSKNGEEENGLVFGCSCLLPLPVWFPLGAKMNWITRIKSVLGVG